MHCGRCKWEARLYMVAVKPVLNVPRVTGLECGRCKAFYEVDERGFLKTTGKMTSPQPVPPGFDS